MFPDVAICYQQQLFEKGVAESSLVLVEMILQIKWLGLLFVVCMWSEIDGYVD